MAALGLTCWQPLTASGATTLGVATVVVVAFVVAAIRTLTRMEASA
ncbi:hypothetical protein [Rathayibacter rathayi]|nr:hypothetical protein [Rathayibacter rathayi]